MSAEAGEAPSDLVAKSLPWLLLALSLSSLLVFSGERGSFYRPHLSHNWDTAKDLAVAANLSLEHRLRLFVRLQPGPEGETGYEVYSRFPLGAYALVKLAILPFDDLGQQLLAARMLMLALFFSAAALAFLALRRIAADRWVALAATLLAFSSFHMLYFSDVVATEIVIDLFGMMLAFHAMVVFAEDNRRFGQLLAKSCVALLLGWHVYALLLPFVVIGLVGEAVTAWSRRKHGGGPANAGHPRRGGLGSVLLAPLRSRFLALGGATLLFGGAVLGFNFGSEHAALKGEVPYAELPSARSMLYRTGQEAESAHVAPNVSWPSFLFRQFHAVGSAAIPYALPVPRDGKGRIDRRAPTGILVAGVGVLAIGACLLAPLLCGRDARAPRGAILVARGRLPLAALALSGFVWTLPMRRSVFDHDYEHLFYVGVPLAAYLLLFGFARRWLGGRLAVGLAVCAALALVLSAREMGRMTAGAQIVELAQALRLDFQRIREKTRGKAIFVAGNGHLGSAYELAAGPFLTAYYLHGSTLQYDTSGHWPDYRASFAARNRSYDFILSDQRVDQRSLLTPGNRFAFLYDGRSFARAHDFYLPSYRTEYEAIAAREPLVFAAADDPAGGAFDVYAGDGELLYLRAPCVNEDTSGVFFLHVVPAHPEELPTRRRPHGFDNLDFRFVDRGVAFDDKCLAKSPLPRYPIAAIDTGRIRPDGTPAWRVHVEVERQGE